MPTERILFLGDVCAEPGREAVKHLLSGLKAELGITFCIVNGENAAGGYGITPKLAEELFQAGADCITTGDHCFDRHEIWELLNTEARLLRPLNFPLEAPGRGFGLYELKPDGKIAVIHLAGRVFMKPIDCPFHRIRNLLPQIRLHTPIIIVDFHAEATAEKRAMGWFLDGQVSAVIGTHTHIPTADETILPAGTAYITDAGMCGAFDSVLGMRKDLSLRRFIEQIPVRLQPATDDIRINGVLIEIDRSTGRAIRIERTVRQYRNPNQPA